MKLFKSALILAATVFAGSAMATETIANLTATNTGYEGEDFVIKVHNALTTGCDFNDKGRKFIVPAGDNQDRIAAIVMNAHQNEKAFRLSVADGSCSAEMGLEVTGAYVVIHAPYELKETELSFYGYDLIETKYLSSDKMYKNDNTTTIRVLFTGKMADVLSGSVCKFTTYMSDTEGNLTTNHKHAINMGGCHMGSTILDVPAGGAFGYKDMHKNSGHRKTRAQVLIYGVTKQ